MSGRSSKLFKLAVLLLLLSGKTFACSEGYGTDHRFILLNPDVYGSRTERPVYFSFSHFLVDPTAAQGRDEWLLAEEWKKELHLQSSVKDINDYFYGQLSDSDLALNPFLKEIRSNKELNRFMTYAKRCEAQVMFSDYWDEKQFAERLKALPVLLKSGEELIGKASSAFWKRKYGFQLLRLAFYSADHKRFYKYYTTYFGLAKRSSPLDWWATHYYSMVLEEKKEVDSANYLHALVFAHSSNKLAVSRQFYAARNFDRQLKLAQNEEEKGDLIAMRLAASFETNMDDLAFLMESYPAHPRLGLLLAREANKFDEQLGRLYYPYENWYFEYYNDVELLAGEKQRFFRELARFETLILELRKKRTNLAFLGLIEAHIALMNKHFSHAKKVLSQIRSTDQKIVFQRQLLELCVLASSENLRDKSVQEELGKRLYSIVSIRKGVYFADQMMESFFQLFSKELEKAGLPHFTATANCFSREIFGEFGLSDVISYLDYRNSIEGCKNWISMFNRQDKNSLERFFCIPFASDSDVKACLARIYFRKTEVENAYKAMNSIDHLAFYLEDKSINCFVPRRPFQRSARTSLGIYRGGEYKRILDVLRKPEKMVKDWMNLGAAFYNASSDGDAYELAHFETSIYSGPFQHGIDQNMWKQSEGYYQQALAANPNAEQKAEILYMLAYLAMMNEDKSTYANLAKAYEEMGETSFYRESNCSYTWQGQWPNNGMDLYSNWHY